MYICMYSVLSRITYVHMQRAAWAGVLLDDDWGKFGWKGWRLYVSKAPVLFILFVYGYGDAFPIGPSVQTHINKTWTLGPSTERSGLCDWRIELGANFCIGIYGLPQLAPLTQEVGEGEGEGFPKNLGASEYTPCLDYDQKQLLARWVIFW